MSEFEPVSTAADLDTLDDAEIMEGYRDGLNDGPEPGNNRSRSYWHGWRVGMMDRSRIPIDDAQWALVQDVMRCGGICRKPGDTGPDMRRFARIARGEIRS